MRPFRLSQSSGFGLTDKQCNATAKGAATHLQKGLHKSGPHSTLLTQRWHFLLCSHKPLPSSLESYGDYSTVSSPPALHHPHYCPEGFELQTLTTDSRLGPHTPTTAGASGIIHVCKTSPKRGSRTTPPFSMPAENLEQVHTALAITGSHPSGTCGPKPASRRERKGVNKSVVSAL